MPVITRFPPSPTGFLHIGGARTALFNWLYARHCSGHLVMRVEDTDRERSTEEAVKAIFDGLDWLGLDYDSGPFFQTQRMDRYREVIDRLLADSRAYHCYCSRERLDALREEQQAAKQKPRYDGHCRHLDQSPAGIDPVVRFRTPDAGTVTVHDQVRGDVRFDNTELDDLVIARSDGSPTYHLTVVVDDIDMNVTHVIRGDDHLNNTPRQIHIIEALGAPLPVYAHVPMIHGPDGRKLSKRHGALSVLEYRDMGFLPEALLNYLVRLGWSHGDDEILSLEQMIALFDIDGINKSAAAFDMDKALWLNQQYIQHYPIADLCSRARPFFEQLGLPVEDEAHFAAAVEAQRTRANTLVEIAANSRMFFAEPELDETAAKKHLRPVAGPALEDVRSRLAELQDWSDEALHAAVAASAEALEIKMGKVAQPLRVAVTGSAASPSIDVTLRLVGRERALARIDRALTYIAGRAEP